MEERSLCDICGREGHEWTAHMNQITKDTGFGLWERAEDGFICGYCNKISPKPTRFCSYYVFNGIFRYT